MHIRLDINTGNIISFLLYVHTHTHIHTIMMGLHARTTMLSTSNEFLRFEIMPSYLQNKYCCLLSYLLSTITSKFLLTRAFLLFSYVILLSLLDALVSIISVWYLNTSSLFL